MSPDVDAADLEHLRAAVVLGRRGRGRVHPNPMVGCVVVKDGAVLGVGWHEEYGAPHAEVHALEAAGGDAEGATAYVSLEPCRHEGKTPACTGALLRAGVARVVFGAADPTDEAGGGAAALRDAGLEVAGPTMSVREARAENPAFFHEAVAGTPWVAAKLAVSLDGRIAAAPGERTRLTGEEGRVAVHRLRAGFDAIVVGSGTARADDPLLTVREGVPVRHPPARVILDSGCTLPPDAAVFRDVAEVPVVVFTRTDAPEHALERLEAAGASVHPVPADPAGGHGLDLAAVLDVCRDTGLGALLVEGGGRLVRSLLAADRIERLHLFVAPKLLGERGVPAFPGERPALDEAWDAWDVVRHGADVELVYERPRPWSHGGPAERLWETPARRDALHLPHPEEA